MTEDNQAKPESYASGCSAGGPADQSREAGSSAGGPPITKADLVIICGIVAKKRLDKVRWWHLSWHRQINEASLLLDLGEELLRLGEGQDDRSRAAG